MADRNLALSILISARDQASSVIANIRNNIVSFASIATAALGAALFKGAIDDAEQLEAQTRKLEAIIKTTGGTAGVTAEQINKMFAGDDNAVAFRNAAAQLLTFKSVGKDVFETTLRLADDLADAGFGNLESSAVQLGKALEDPVQGLTALSRSGVTFSETEQLLIKQLVETGDKAKAQGIILEAVAGQVGGVADAVGSGFRGANESIDASLRQIRENIGGALTPALTILASGIASVSARWAEMSTTTDAAGNSVKSFSGVANFLAKTVAIAGFAVDQLGRGIGATAANLTLLAQGDFAGIGEVFKSYYADSADSFKKLNDQLDDIEKPRAVNVSTNVNGAGIQSATSAINADVAAIINQFQIWDKTSIDSISNISAELKKLSDVELDHMRKTLNSAFDAGTQGSKALQDALNAINTESVTRAWKTLGQESSASLKKAADSAKAAYVTIRDSGTASAADLDKAWASVTKQILAAKDATNAADEAEKQRKANLSELAQIGATPQEKLQAKNKELTDQTIAYDKAKREGDFAQAAQIAKEKEALAFENAKAETEAAQAGEVASYHAYDAKQKYLRAIQDTKTALAELKQQEQANLPADKNGPDNQGKEGQNGELTAKQQEAQKLQQTLDLLKQPINIQVNDNFASAIAAADQLQQRVNALNASIQNANANAAGNEIGQETLSTDSTQQALAREVLKRGRRTQ